ncbi:hypothetical protein ACQPX6_16680 [Actinomycetospora sp. CA-101289]|uniref:hypothetical protein n=1 Tax=Actinomycetospora sp. CA-101289 TaxID=3239893 RepID=UPI003D976884
MTDDERPGKRGGGAASQAREHLVWHQDLICPEPRCRGRVRRFPPGELVDGGRRERRRCPECGTSITVPAFYLVPWALGDSSELPPAA